MHKDEKATIVFGQTAVGWGCYSHLKKLAIKSCLVHSLGEQTQGITSIKIVTTRLKYRVQTLIVKNIKNSSCFRPFHARLISLPFYLFVFKDLLMMEMSPTRKPKIKNPWTPKQVLSEPGPASALTAAQPNNIFPSLFITITSCSPPTSTRSYQEFLPHIPWFLKLLRIWNYISGITRDQPNVHMLRRERTTRLFKTREYFSFINSLHFWIQWRTTRSVCTETKEISCVSTNHSVTQIINTRRAAICKEAGACGRGGKEN